MFETTLSSFLKVFICLYLMLPGPNNLIKLGPDPRAKCCFKPNALEMFSLLIPKIFKEIESQEMILPQWTNLSSRKTFPHSKKKGNGPNFCLPLTKVWERYRLTEGDKY